MPVCEFVYKCEVLLSRYKTFNVRVNDVYVTRGNTAVVKCFVDPYYVRDYVAVKSWTQGRDILTTGSYTGHEQITLLMGMFQFKTVNYI